MKKLSLALLTLMVAGYAGVVSAVTVVPTTPAPVKFVNKTANSACIKAVVEARENAIITAYTKMGSEIAQALSVRSSELSLAWSSSDVSARTKAINSAWAKYKNARKASVKNYRSAIDNAWKNYKNSTKNCKIDNKAVDTKVEETKDNGAGIDKALE